MAVTSVSEIWDDREGESDEQFIDTLTRRFRVITNSMSDGPATVSVATGLPRRWDLYTDPNGFPDFVARCQSISVKQTEDPFVWIATAKYTSKRVFKEEARQAAKGGSQIDQNPLNRPADITWGLSTYQKVAEHDVVSGKPVVNSAGMKFDPPIEIDDSRVTLTIVRNEPSFDPALAIAYADSINTDSFFGAPNYAAKVKNISASFAFESQISFWKVRYEFEFKAYDGVTYFGWLLRVLDQGYMQLDAASGDSKWIACKDSELQPVTQPALLDGTGHQLSPPPKPDGTGGTPVFRLFHVYKEQAFAGLNLSPSS